MEIKFSTSDDVQIISISGALSQAEAAAVRNKLEDKINLGRSKVIFDLADYQLDDNAARSYLLNIVTYSLNRGVLSACCGAPPALWPLLLVGGTLQAQTFLSRSEALEYLKKQTAPKIKTHAAAEVASDANTTSSTLKSLTQKTEDEIQEARKSQALKDLLQQYSVFQQTDQDDPFRLDFFAQQIKADSSVEALAAEKKASESVVKIDEEILALEADCKKLASQLKHATIVRKSPVSEKELHLKQETLDKGLGELKTQVKSLAMSFETRELELDTLLKSFEYLKITSAATLAALEQEFANLQKTSESKLNELKTRDAAEQLEFDEKKKALTKPQV
jgi:anti-anti-sigma regulatory factor